MSTPLPSKSSSQDEPHIIDSSMVRLTNVSHPLVNIQSWLTELGGLQMGNPWEGVRGVEVRNAFEHPMQTTNGPMSQNMPLCRIASESKL